MLNLLEFAVKLIPESKEETDAETKETEQTNAPEDYGADTPKEQTGAPEDHGADTPKEHD